MYTSDKPKQTNYEKKIMKTQGLHLLFLSAVLFLSNCKKESSGAAAFPDSKGTKSVGSKLGVTALASMAPLQTVANGTVVIVNKLSGKVLDVDGSKSTNGTTV